MSQHTQQILVVDDDAAVCRMVKTYLELEGYAVDLAANGDDALTQANQKPPHAVLLDVMMPGTDGYSICKKLRENSRMRGLVIILVSVLDKPDARIHGLQVGADDFLTKPFDPSELVARLKAHLRRVLPHLEKERMMERMAEKLALMNRRLQEEAATDSLTRLYNRRHFCKRFEEELERSRRYGHPLSFVFLDLDGFKQINDDYGHPFGDCVLKEFARFLRSRIRGADLICRWGGEEFGLLFPETPLQEAEQAGKRLLQVCQSFSVPPLAQGKPTFSAGVSAFPEHGSLAEELYDKADKALYRAKTNGKNSVVVAELRINLLNKRRKSVKLTTPQ